MRDATITGIFKGEANVAQCLKHLCRLSIAVEKISVSGIKSRNLRVLAGRLLAVRPDTGKIITIVGLSGSVSGALMALCATVMSPPWGLFPDLGMLGSLSVGGVLGCMCGTLIGCVAAVILSSLPSNVREERLAENQVVIVVQIPQQFPEMNTVRAIMQEFGAVSLPFPNLGYHQPFEKISAKWIIDLADGSIGLSNELWHNVHVPNGAQEISDFAEILVYVDLL